MKSFLPHLDSSVDEVFQSVGERHDDGGSLLQIAGPPSSGKSVALRELGSRLEKSEDRFPVVVSPPARALDSGPVALMQIGSQLVEHDVKGSEDGLEFLIEPKRPWKEKLDLVRDWMTTAKDEAVILCDEPDLWPADSHWHFARAAQDIVDKLVLDGTGCDVVVAGRLPHGTVVTDKKELRNASDPEHLLSADWGPLRKGAKRVQAIGAEKLRRFSPLQIRLIVALSVVAPEKDPSTWIENAEITELATTLLDRMKLEEQWADLLDCWKRLARVRVPFDDDLLDFVRAGDLEQRERALLERCLLYEQQDRRMLHETLRSEAQRSKPLEGEEKLQGALADYYRSRFQKAEGGAAIAFEMEAHHHASKSGAFDFAQHRTFFVEQLDALGYHLSKEEGLYKEAVEAYRRALDWDPNDDYAHHYLAFNLDIEARKPEEAEKHYTTAVDLNPSHPWWHTSLVNFYVATGRIDRAREAWNAARGEFETPDANLTVHQCQDLYLPVARTLLEFGQVDFCEMVLRGVPDDLRGAVSGYETVRKKMEAARLARDHGNFVPGPLLRANWWEKGPFLLPKDDVTEWIAGEVKESSKAGILVEAAVVRPAASEGAPPGGPIEIDAQQMQDWGDLEPGGLVVGDFIEIVTTKVNGETATQMAFHPIREWIDDSLPELRPNPKRYL